MNTDFVFISNAGTITNAPANGATNDNEWELFQIFDGKTTMNVTVDLNRQEVFLKPPVYR